MKPGNSTVLVATEDDSIFMRTVQAIVSKTPGQRETEGINRLIIVTNVEDDRESKIMNIMPGSDNTETLSELCRICANISDQIVPIFQGEGVEHEICNKIHKYLPIRVSETDSLPLQLCYHCATTLLEWHQLSESCLSAQHRLLQIQANLHKKEQCSPPSNLGSKGTEIEDSVVEEKESQTEPDDNQNPEQSLKKIETRDLEATETERSNKDQTAFKEFHDLQNISWKSIVEKSEQPSIAKEDSKTTSIMNPEPDPSLENYTKTLEHPEPKDFTDDSTDEEDWKGLETEEWKDDSGSQKVRKVQEMYTCEECKRGFKLKDSYMRHMRIHKDERPFTCDKCGKQFRDSGGLSRHLKDVHSKIKNFACDLCGTSFASKATREDHRRTHTGERPYVCEECGKTFKSKASLYTHNKIHTNIFPHVCSSTGCGKKFRRRQEVLAHMTTHTGERNYKCDKCDRRFRVKSELVRHKLIHSTEKPFSCDQCGTSFRQKRYLNNHMKNRHTQSLKR